MKNLFAFFMIATAFVACNDDCTSEYPEYLPITTTLSELRSIQNLPAQDMENTGKIYVYGKYLLINEVRKGIHILDNSDQRNPKKVGFIGILGNRDMAVKDNILYADNYLDLMAIDISDINNPKVLYIQENVFNTGFSSDFLDGDVETQFVVAYEKTGKTLSMPCDDVIYYYSDGATSVSNGTTVGQGGSLARFTIHNDLLYAVDNYKLNSIDISNPQELSVLNQTNVEWGIETIFSTDNELFIGGQLGMYIYNIADNPQEPTYASHLQHIEACDPVIVDESIAYITLSTSTFCGGETNELVTADVTNIYYPETIGVMKMSGPKGLGIQGDNLFICEQKEGLRVYDKKVLDDYLTDQIGHIKNIHANDIILLPNQTAIVLTDSGFAQYDISDIEHMKKISDFNY